MTIMRDPKMGLYHGENGLYSGRRGLYAGPKRHGGGFSPTQLPGLLAWWDPSIPETITNATGGVSQLYDSSGNAEHIVQTTESRRATETTLNGLAAIDFNDPTPVDEQLTNSTIALGSTQTVFQVIRPRTDVSLNRYCIGNGVVSPTDAGFRIQLTTGRGFVFQVSDGIAPTTLVTPNTIWSDQEVLVLVACYDGSDLVLRANGTEYTTPSTRDPSRTGNFACAANYAGAFNGEFKGISAEAGVCGVLSAGETASLESYLAAKWGATLA